MQKIIEGSESATSPQQSCLDAELKGDLERTKRLQNSGGFKKKRQVGVNFPRLSLTQTENVSDDIVPLFAGERVHWHTCVWRGECDQ